MEIYFKKYHENAQLPVKVHGTDACYDVVATSIEDLGDGRIVYGLGFGLQPQYPEYGTQFDIRARSSIHNTGLIIANGVGTVDSGYTGELKVVFYNIIKELPNYKVGDRIAQIQLIKSEEIWEFKEVDNLISTDRGEGGFGSTN